jgi:hypothetical protein
MHSFWASFFGRMRRYFSWMVQWTAIILCIDILNIRNFMSQRICWAPPPPSRPPDSTSPGFFLWGYLKDAVYTTNWTVLRSHPRSKFCGCSSVAQRCQLCHEANDGHFEHLH